MISPIMIRAMDEVLKTIPIGLQEASYALGSTRTETAYKIFFRQVLPGFATAVLLCFLAEALAMRFVCSQPVILTMCQEVSKDPTATLPLAIFFQLGSPIESVQNRAFCGSNCFNYYCSGHQYFGKAVIPGQKINQEIVNQTKTSTMTNLSTTTAQPGSDVKFRKSAGRNSRIEGAQPACEK